MLPSMRFKTLLALIVIGILPTLLSALEKREIRTFTDTNGKKIEAELKDVKDGKVKLIVNLKPFEVPIEIFSKEDQDFIQTWDIKRQGKEEEMYYSDVLFTDNFDSDGFGERWGHYKSKSVVKGGVLIGKTIDIKDHAGVDSIRFPDGYKDMEVSVKFNFAGESAERFNVWFDDHEYKGSHAGHICSISVSPTQLNVSDAKTGNFENSIYEKRSGGGTLDEATTELLKSKSTTFPLDLKRETWHTLLIRTKGDEVIVSINGFEIGKFKSEGIAHDHKSLVSLTTNIDDVQYDDFSIKAAPASKAVADEAAESKK